MQGDCSPDAKPRSKSEELKCFLALTEGENLFGKVSR